MPDCLLVITTMPDAESGERLAEGLVESGLAGCVNISAPVTSVYRWDGVLERGTEVLLTIKTTPARYAALESAIVAGHPYELPEVIAVPITGGLPAYLNWIEACTRE